MAPRRAAPLIGVQTLFKGRWQPVAFAREAGGGVVNFDMHNANVQIGCEVGHVHAQIPTRAARTLAFTTSKRELVN